MFRLAPILRRVSPFSLFLMDQKKNASLSGMPIVQRGKMLAEMYKTLPKEKRAVLEKRAKMHPPFAQKRQLKRPSFQEYSKKYLGTVKALEPSKRKAALARMYALKKPVVIQGTKGRRVTFQPCKNLEVVVKKNLRKYEHKDRGETPKKKTGKDNVARGPSQKKIKAPSRGSVKARRIRREF
eukprot:gene6720-4815_t